MNNQFSFLWRATLVCAVVLVATCAVLGQAPPLPPELKPMERELRQRRTRLDMARAEKARNPEAEAKLKADKESARIEREQIGLLREVIKQYNAGNEIVRRDLEAKYGFIKVAVQAGLMEPPMGRTLNHRQRAGGESATPMKLSPSKKKTAGNRGHVEPCANYSRDGQA